MTMIRCRTRNKRNKSSIKHILILFLLTIISMMIVLYQHHQRISNLEQHPNTNNFFGDPSSYYHKIFSSSSSSSTGRRKQQKKIKYQKIPPEAHHSFYSDPKLSQVSKYLTGHLNWTRTEDFTKAELLWYQKKKRIKWTKLKPWQRANHLTNENALGDKGRMLDFLLPSTDNDDDINHNIPPFVYLPETYRLWIPSERHHFFNLTTTNSSEENIGLWALKIPTIDGGKGVSLLSTKQQTFNLRHSHNFTSDRLLVQRYIDNPLLTLEGHKFDLRVHWLIGSVDPPVVFVKRDPTLRVSVEKYQKGKLDLTNAVQQKGREGYEEKREMSRRGFGSLDEILVGRFPDLFGGEEGDGRRDVMCLVQRALAEVFVRSREVLGRDSPTENGFVLLGADFMIDEDLKIWLIEIQSGPGLPRKISKAIAEYMDEMIPEMVDLVLEIGEKQRSRKGLWPLENLNKFDLILNGTKVEDLLGGRVEYSGWELLELGSTFSSCVGVDTVVKPGGFVDPSKKSPLQ